MNKKLKNTQNEKREANLDLSFKTHNKIDLQQIKHTKPRTKPPALKGSDHPHNNNKNNGTNQQKHR